MKTISILAILLLAACTREASTNSEAAARGTIPVEPYPLDVCIVSGEKLGSMGDPVVLVYKYREIKFCCDKCMPKFEKEPDKYLPKLGNP